MSDSLQQQLMLPFALEFNRSVRVHAADHRLSSLGGALPLRELDERLGLVDALAAMLHDPRLPEACTFSMRELLRTRLIGMALGCGSQSDADRRRHDAALELAVTDRRGQHAIDDALPSQPTMSRLVAALASRHNRRALLYTPLEMAIRSFGVRRDHRHRYITLDLDSTDIQTHGEQHLANYNGYHGHTCYEVLLASIAETADLCGILLRRGNVSSARGAKAFVTPILDRLEQSQAIGQIVDVRFDAAFAIPELMDELDRRRINFVGRIKSNPNLEALAEPFLRRPVGRPRNELQEWHYELEYGAESWGKTRRVVLVVIDDPQDRYLGQRMLRHFFLVTSHRFERMPAAELVPFYRQRGEFESRIGEFKQAMQPKLSSSRWRENAATLSLYAIAYQWLHLLRVLSDTAERKQTRSSLLTIRQALLVVAVRLTRSARYIHVWLERAAVTSWQRLFDRLHKRLARQKQFDTFAHAAHAPP